MVRGVVSGCIGTAENSENLKKMVGAQNLSISCDRQPRNWEGKKKTNPRKKGKPPSQTPECLFSLPARNHCFVLLAKEDEGCQALKVGVK